MFYIFNNSRYICCESTYFLNVESKKERILKQCALCIHYCCRLQSTCWTAAQCWTRRACMKRLWELSQNPHHEEDLPLSQPLYRVYRDILQCTYTIICIRHSRLCPSSMCSLLDLLCRVEAQRGFIYIVTEYLYVIYCLKHYFMIELFSTTERIRMWYLVISSWEYGVSLLKEQTVTFDTWWSTPRAAAVRRPFSLACLASIMDIKICYIHLKF